MLSLLEKMIPDDFVVIRSTDDFNEKIISTPDPYFRAFVLGIEGGDFIETDLNRLDEVFNRGVRLMTLVHFSNNTIGHRCMDLEGKENDSSKGLTDFGENVVKKMNTLGMIIDLAHCNEKTANDVIDLSKKPVVASHTGPRALQDFPRYISDDLMLRISENGGVVGIWPFFKNACFQKLKLQ
jgi:membrane dipeptidase